MLTASPFPVSDFLLGPSIVAILREWCHFDRATPPWIPLWHWCCYSGSACDCARLHAATSGCDLSGQGLEVGMQVCDVRT